MFDLLEYLDGVIAEQVQSLTFYMVLSTSKSNF